MFSSERRRAEEYLDRTRVVAEEESDILCKNFTEIGAEVATPLTEKPWQEEGVVSFELPTDETQEKPTVCTIEYDSFLDEKITDHVRAYSNPDAYDDKPDASLYRRIKGFVLDNGEDRFDLKTFGENSVYMYFDPNEDPQACVVSSAGFMDEKIGFFHIKGDLRTVFGIHILLHELGHISSEKTPSRETKLRTLARGKHNRQEGTVAKEQAAIIRAEKSASAFAVNLERKFLPADIVRDLRTLCHFSINNYHQEFDAQAEFNKGQHKEGWIKEMAKKLFKVET
ncbi:MAG: hypothetical protein WC845_02610 [Candidatus Staskawiczbacteria bacterium]|jgi:hypothetical protein